jgi:hypothetical protein
MGDDAASGDVKNERAGGCRVRAVCLLSLLACVSAVNVSCQARGTLLRSASFARRNWLKKRIGHDPACSSWLEKPTYSLGLSRLRGVLSGGYAHESENWTLSRLDPARRG